MIMIKIRITETSLAVPAFVRIVYTSDLSDLCRVFSDSSNKASKFVRR